MMKHQSPDSMRHVKKKVLEYINIHETLNTYLIRPIETAK